MFQVVVVDQAVCELSKSRAELLSDSVSYDARILALLVQFDHALVVFESCLLHERLPSVYEMPTVHILEVA